MTATTDLRTLLNGMEIWAKDIGPLRGEHHLITLTGPGIYEVVGPNTGGKSTLLKIMLLFMKQRLLRADGAHVTDGELEGYLYMKPAKLRFSVNAQGEPAVPERTDSDALPAIVEIPNPIELLISGGHVKGEAARARLRLEQLLTFAPIVSTDDLVTRLCRTMDDRAFGEDGIDTDFLMAWDVLLSKVASRKKRFKPLDFGTPGSIRDALYAEQRESILDDQDWLVKALNALGNAAENAIEEQRGVVATFNGRLNEAVEAAGRRLGEPATPDLRHRLERWDGDLQEIGTRLESARSRAARVRVERDDRLRQVERLDAIRQSHGDRPDIESLKSESGTKGLAADEARQHHDACRGITASKREGLGDLRAAAAAKLTTAQDAYSRWRRAVDGLESRLGNPSAPSGLVLPAAEFEVGDIAETSSALATAVGAAITAAAEVNTREAEAADAQNVEDRALGALTLAEEAFNAAAAALRRGEEEVSRWDETEAALSTPVPGSTTEQVESADAEVEAIQGEIAMAEAADAFRLVVAEQASEQALMAWLETVATDYREAAKDSWSHLGAIVTDSLSLPWLSVNGLKIELTYDKTTKRLATDDSADTEVRDLDDTARISTAELHESMLQLMLSRQDELGGIVILPWDYERPSAIAALDDDRKARFAGDVEEHGLVIFAERPKRKGEGDEVSITKVEAVAS